MSSQKYESANNYVVIDDLDYATTSSPQATLSTVTKCSWKMPAKSLRGNRHARRAAKAQARRKR